MIDILYEDNHVLVAVKPPNMLSQADDTGDTDILTYLKNDIKVRYQKPGSVYLGLVHRLDRPVGGLMVFARTSKAAARLSAQFQKHELGREYLCIVEGSVPPSFTLVDYLIKDPRLNIVTVCSADNRKAQEAILHGRCLAQRENTSLVSVRLETGRNHQIRVQMSHAGNPLWGDNRYGHGIPGQQIALWGYRVRFEHPTTHQILAFMSMPHGGIWTRYQDVLDRLWGEFQVESMQIPTMY
jgi:23S rRNA pseudouridine1911/1915/1917 synthase